MSTYEEAEQLAGAALEWAFAQLSTDARLAPLARGAEGTPLHVLIRSTLAMVAEHLESELHGPLGDGPDDKAPGRAQLERVRAALGFAYARALDVALANPTTAVAEAEAPAYFEPELRRDAGAELARLVELLAEAQRNIQSLEKLSAATRGHLNAGVPVPLHRDSLQLLTEQLDALVSGVATLTSAAYRLTAELTFHAALRAALPYAPLLGLSRREQQRTLLSDALRLHDDFGLSEAEIGAIWADNPPEHAEAKRQGGKVLARARQAARDATER